MSGHDTQGAVKEEEGEESKNESGVLHQGALSSVERTSGGGLRIRMAGNEALGDGSKEGVKKFAIRRLRRDMKKCVKEPLPMIAALPLDKNIFRWHANLMGPPGSAYEDVCFHLVIKVPEDYPRNAPKVKLKSYMNHPNVFGQWICLDMLEGQWVADDKSQKKTDVGYGWTPAYDIQTILVQLQAFLFDMCDTTWWAKYAQKRGYTSTMRRARVQAKSFQCKKCRHKGTRPWPEPLAWKERLRFMVPSDEIVDIDRTKSELWRFLERVDGMCLQNRWPRIMPLKAGSFFSYTLLPWWDDRYAEQLALRQAQGTRKMHPRRSATVRALVQRTANWLSGNPPPSKAALLERMYLIESALDLAAGNAHASKFTDRERGYWQWRKTDLVAKPASDDEEEGGEDAKSTEASQEGNKKAGEEKESKEDVWKWNDFPVQIGHQIEALYLRWQADLRRPGELVQIDEKPLPKGQVFPWVRERMEKERKLKGELSSKGVIASIVKNDYEDLGIITKPRGYHASRMNEKELTAEEKKQVFQPYSGQDTRVRVMRIDPLRTTRNKVWYWHAGPFFYRGQRRDAIYYKTDTGKPYWKKSMILDRLHDAHGVWYLCVHPLPTRKDINKAKFYDISRLRVASQGRYYKGYTRGPDDKHYVIDLYKGTVRCVEDNTIYPIRRKVRKRSTEQLWKEILTKADTKDADVPWKKAPEEVITPFDPIDWRKFRSVCPFIDIADQLDEEDEDEDEESVSNGSDTALGSERDDKSRKDAQRAKVIPQLRDWGLDYPRVGQQVSGIVTRIVRYGAFMDIGGGRNAFMHISQLRAPKAVVDKALAEFQEEDRRREERARIATQKAEKAVLELQKQQHEAKLRHRSEKRRRNRQRKRNQGVAKQGANKEATNGSATQPATPVSKQQGKKGKAQQSPQRKEQGKKGKKGSAGKATTDTPQKAKSPQKEGRKKQQSPAKGKGATASGPGGGTPQKKGHKGKRKKPADDEKQGEKTRQPATPKKMDPQKVYAALEDAKQAEAKADEEVWLPSGVDYMNQALFSVGDYLEDLWIDDVYRPLDRVNLTQFRPLENIRVGERLEGHVRCVLPDGAYVDVGAAAEAWVSREIIEAAKMSCIIFDTRHHVKLGSRMKLIVTAVDSWQKLLEAKIDRSEVPPDCLRLPGDFDESRAVRVSIFGLMPDDVSEICFQFLDRGSLHRCRDVCVLFQRIIDDRTALRWEIDELKCYHTKNTFRDEVLGMGVNIERWEGNSTICGIEPKLELLSAKSFETFGVRTSVWKEPFTHWLPVYLHPSHGERSIPLAKRKMSEMIRPGTVSDWNPFYPLKILPALMNSMVVKVMEGELHESIVALEGYTMFYHLLLAFVQMYPKLQAFIDRNVASFLESEEKRVKKFLPSLGEWIALLAASDRFVWRDVVTTYLRENFDRNAKWILTANNEMMRDDISQRVRLRESFKATQVSLKLCMFHVCFLRLFRYSQRSGTVLSVEQTKKRLDRLYGRPTHNMKLTLQRNVKRIKKLKSYQEFFQGVGVKPLTDDEVFIWLVEALHNSERRRYHKRYWFQKKKKPKKKREEGDKADALADEWDGKDFRNISSKW